jgi:hypothetical protein
VEDNKIVKDISKIRQAPHLCIRCGEFPVLRTKRGICSRCYSFLRNNNKLDEWPEIFPPFSIMEMFNKKIQKADGCWLWVGAKNNKGYGQFRVQGKSTLAHRTSWILKNGEIPPHLNVLHKCDVRNCVNPDHLFLGTLKDNMRDCSNKGRLSVNWPGYKGEQHKLSKLTVAEVLEIRSDEKQRGYGMRLAKKYGVSPSTIYDAAKGRLWAHI